MLSCCSVSPNHVLVDSLRSVRVFKLFSRSIHHIFGRRGTCTDAYCKVDKGREVYVNHGHVWEV